jgi:hypothetical protein
VQAGGPKPKPTNGEKRSDEAFHGQTLRLYVGHFHAKRYKTLKRVTNGSQDETHIKGGNWRIGKF